jgi:NAD(P)-dependent dehydrogenase (short-subunit alcohol dehydrogenase family)
MILKDKVVVVTGGAGLIGKEFIKATVQSGGIGVIADINIKLGEEAKESLSKKFKTDKIDFIQLDITSKKSLEDSINYLSKKYGKIDALVNNAYPRNKHYGKDFLDIEYDEFSENLNMNLGGYLISSQQFAKYFLNQGFGNIINISSIYGVIAPRFEIYKNTNMVGVPIEYGAVKSALIHLTKYLAKYFKNKNIRINAISPGGVFDNQPENFLNAYKDNCLNKGMLEQSDLTGTLIYLLSDMSQFVNGQNIIVDDGFHL